MTISPPRSFLTRELHRFLMPPALTWWISLPTPPQTRRDTRILPICCYTQWQADPADLQRFCDLNHTRARSPTCCFHTRFPQHLRGSRQRRSLAKGRELLLPVSVLQSAALLQVAADDDCKQSSDLTQIPAHGFYYALRFNPFLPILFHSAAHLPISHFI